MNLKKIIPFLIILFLLQSCDEFSENDTSELITQINSYCKKIDGKVYKSKISRMLPNLASIGGKQLNSEKIIDEITNETSKYLQDVAQLVTSGKKNIGLEESLKNTFKLYKKTVEDDVPRLSLTNSKNSEKLKINEDDLEKIIDELKTKKAIITKQLIEIEKKASEHTQEILEK